MWYEPKSCVGLVAEQWLAKIIESQNSAPQFLSFTNGIATGNHTGVEQSLKAAAEGA